MEIKTVLCILFFAISIHIHAQQDTIPQVNETTIDTTILKKTRTKFGGEVYVGASNVLGNRVLLEREGLFGAPLGLREDESSYWTWSFDFGVRMPLYKSFGLDLGMSFVQIGNSNTAESVGPLVMYRNIYQYLAMPMSGFFQFGEDFLVQVGAGFQPRFFMGGKYIETSLNEFNKEIETTTKLNNGYNSLALDVNAHLGFRWNVMENIGVYFIPEFGYNLLDEFNNQQPHVQRSYGLFLKWGLHWQL